MMKRRSGTYSELVGDCITKKVTNVSKGRKESGITTDSFSVYSGRMLFDFGHDVSW